MASFGRISRACVRGICSTRTLRFAPPTVSARIRMPDPIRRQPVLLAVRGFASQGKSVIDEKIEEIQDQYATAKDEFEIAMEETESNTVYAQDDRNAAREEFDKLKELYEAAVEDAETGEEISKRIGTRIRELENAVKNMEEFAQNQD